MAVSRRRARAQTSQANPKDQTDQAEETQWFAIVAWEQLAETCERLLHAGDKVYVEGRIGSHTYTDREGVERTIWEVTAADIQLLDSRKTRAPHIEPGDHTAERRAS